MRPGLLVASTAACLLGIAGVGFAAPPTPDPDLQCRFRHNVIEVDSIDAVPRPIQNIMLAHMDQKAREDAKFEWHRVMAPRGGEFNSTDAIVGDYPSRRFIRAGHEGNEWFVWFERGGLAYSKNIVLFHLRLGHAVPVVRAFVSYFRENPCTLTDDLIDGKQPAAKPTDVW